MKTVLIVDDEELFLASLSEGLSAYANEFTVVTAPDGEKAKSILESRPIDLVVTDLKMPVMDGLQLIAYMMRNYPPIPVIVMTAFGTPDIEGCIGEFDILGYMEKPIDYHVLAEKIRLGLSEPARGQIEGITLFSFLQLLQMEHKTCSLKIQSGENEGYLHFSAGELFNALLGDTEGEEAAYKILSWDDTKIEIISAARKMKKQIQTSLNNLLMRAAQLRDERSRPAVEEDQPATGILATPGVTAHAATAPAVSAHAVQSANRLDQDDMEKILDRLIVPATPEINSAREKSGPAANPANRKINEILGRIAGDIVGFIGASVVDLESGTTLGVQTISPDFDLGAASAYDSEMVRHEIKAMKALKLNSTLEDILLTLSDQIHLIKMVSGTSFIYLAADRSLTNPAVVRNTVAKYARALI